MNRTAILFGLWTILCMVLAIVGFFAIADLADADEGYKGVFSLDNPSWRAIGFLSSFAPVAGIVAGLLWALFHRHGRSPGWLSYALLAGLVVVVSHMLVFGGIGAIGSDAPFRDLVGAMFMFVVHGWLSVPVAFAGTAIFVLWNRHRALPKAAPSAPSS